MKRLPLSKRRPKPDLIRAIWYEMARKFCGILIWIFYRPIVIGSENVPHFGPVMIAANHQSYLDPPLVCFYYQRQSAFVARAGLFKSRIFGFMLRNLNSTPIKEQGGDTAAIKEVLRRLGEGWPIVIFPEGSRCFDGAMQPFKRGISLLVKMSKAPVVPAALEGCFDCFPRNGSPRFYWRGPRIALKYGKPIPYEELMKDGQDAALARLQDEIDKVRLELRAMLRARNADHYPPAGLGDLPVRRSGPQHAPEDRVAPARETPDASASADASQKGS